MNLTEQQRTIAKVLARDHGFDPKRVHFLNPDDPTEPWLPTDVLLTIARQSGNFQTIAEEVDRYLPELNQVVHTATVVDNDGRVFKRPGIATLGEKTPGGEQMDVHDLAGTRALNKALTSAGFNPVRAQPAKTDDAGKGVSDETFRRNSDLKRIHLLAERAGLITYDEVGKKELRPYREWLLENFGVESVAGLDEMGRASVIQELRLKAGEAEV